MVAQTSPGSQQQDSTTEPMQARNNLPRLMQSITRLITIQSQLLLARTQLTAKKIVLYVALMAGAVSAMIVGAIFLLIGLFRALTSVLTLAVGPEWAPTISFVIWAAVLAGAAIIMVMLAARIFAPARPDAAEDAASTPQQESPSKEPP